MTPHPLVTQLRFTRREWVRGLGRVTAEEAAWMIGHLAWQEQRYFLELAQGTMVAAEVKRFGYGQRR